MIAIAYAALKISAIDVMTEPRDFLLDTADGQRSITIDPINVTPSTGIMYSTGQYDLREGDVGIGTITFTTNKDWTFDGVGDINNEDVRHIARFIMKIDSKPAPLADAGPLYNVPAQAIDMGGSPALKTLAFMVQENGRAVDVRVEIYNKVYAVTIGGKSGIQLEQDHHGNWYATKGQVNDAVVQEIGRRITSQLMNEGFI